MSYGSGRLPMEHASKLGHMKVIEHEQLRRLLLSFEQDDERRTDLVGERTGKVDLAQPSPIRCVIAIDGGEAIIPNSARRGRRMAFIKLCALCLHRADLDHLRRHPISDPRDLSRLFDNRIWFQPAALPLSGIHIPGQTLRDTVRDTVHAVLEYTSLCDVLAFLVYRRWDPEYDFDCHTNPDAPHMDCLQCGEVTYLPREAVNFDCPSCRYPHRLSDYLGITQNMPVDWSREEAAINLRNVLETLALFHGSPAVSVIEPPDVRSEPSLVA